MNSGLAGHPYRIVTSGAVTRWACRMEMVK